jgi:hypothetical protein
MAKNKEWDRLTAYYAHDVRILYDIYRRRMIVHPRSLATFYILDISEPGLHKIARHRVKNIAMCRAVVQKILCSGLRPSPGPNQ